MLCYLKNFLNSNDLVSFLYSHIYMHGLFNCWMNDSVCAFPCDEMISILKRYNGYSFSLISFLFSCYSYLYIKLRKFKHHSNIENPIPNFSGSFKPHLHSLRSDAILKLIRHSPSPKIAPLRRLHLHDFLFIRNPSVSHPVAVYIHR